MAKKVADVRNPKNYNFGSWVQYIDSSGQHCSNVKDVMDINIVTPMVVYDDDTFMAFVVGIGRPRKYTGIKHDSYDFCSASMILPISKFHDTQDLGEIEFILHSRDYTRENQEFIWNYLIKQFNKLKQ